MPASNQKRVSAQRRDGAWEGMDVPADGLRNAFSPALSDRCLSLNTTEIMQAGCAGVKSFG